MRGRTLVLAVVLFSLAVQPVAADSTVENACAGTGSGEKLVGVLPDGTATSGTLTLYQGTTFEVALCKDGDLKPTRGSEWTLDSPPGLEVVNATDAAVTVRVTGEAERTNVPEYVPEKSGLAGVEVAFAAAPTVESKLVDGSLVVESGDAEAYREAEGAYLDALADLDAATAAVNESAAAVRSGGAADDAALANVSARAETVSERRAALEKRLYEAAWNAPGDTRAFDAISAARERENAAEADARRALTAYREALADANASARTTVWLNLGGAALLGVVLGALPGWKLTASVVSDRKRDQEVNASVRVGATLLWRVVALAVVALAATAGALVALDGIGLLAGLL